MKTFDDLVFEPHPTAVNVGAKDAVRARIDFDNGWGVSVIHDGGEKQKVTFYSGVDTFEVAPMFEGKIARNTTSDELTDRRGVWGWQTKEEVTRRMRQLQELPSGGIFPNRNALEHEV